MWIRLAGSLFWIFCGVVLWRLLRSLPGRAAWRRGPLVLWALALALACALFFRPHEDWFGGQDSGAYLNLGARYGRVPRLFFTDPLLADVPTAAREDFLYYGHSRPYLSKYACGAVRDLAAARMGPWFQPALPVVLGIPAALASPRGALYAVPLFALLTALVVGRLAGRLLGGPHTALLAFLFYVTLPLTVWHGRCVRPEFIASFLLFGGAALLADAWQGDRWRRPFALALGSCCLALAPFFHATAWMFHGPAAVLVGLALLSGRHDFLLYIPFQMAALALFGLQIRHVTDTYHLAARVLPLLGQPWPWLGLVLLSAALGGISLWVSAVRRRAQWSWPAPLARLVGAGLAAATVAAYVGVYLVARSSRPVAAVEPATQYIYRTDLVAVLNMISVPTAVLGLLGLVVALARGGAAAVPRRALLCFAVPATLMVGNMYDFFMTRYLVVALLPLLAFGLAALVRVLPDRAAWGRRAVWAAAGVVIVLNLHGRTHLVRIREFRGLTDTLAGVAERVRSEDAILLAEYPRIAAPLDLAFGVPTLAMHSERDRDADRALQAWQAVMAQQPTRPALFLTPYDYAPVDPRFVFTPLAAPVYGGRRLPGRQWDLPVDTAPWGCRLALYRMAVRDPADPVHDWRAPWLTRFDQGNVGLTGFDRVEEFPMTARGHALAAGTPLRLSLPDPARAPVTVALVGYSGTETPPVLELAVGAAVRPVQALPLRGGWRLFIARADGPGEPRGELRVRGEGRLLAACVRAVTGDTVVSALDPAVPPDADAWTEGPVRARWAPPGAFVTVPAPMASGGWVCARFAVPEERADKAVVRLTPGPAAGRTYAGGAWTWDVWPLPPSPEPFARLKFEARTGDDAVPVILESVVVMRDPREG